ncbi:hypothetical protein BDD12DRAFT_201781 [Trichophaea hybrida]|nr:hypothetical protein BDD12DRAFT_201781 [Trichophaea hybrida]
MSWVEVVAGKFASNTLPPQTPSSIPQPSGPSPQVQPPSPSLTPSTDPPTNEVPDTTLCVTLVRALRSHHFISADTKDICSRDLDSITDDHGPFKVFPPANRRVAPVLDPLAAIAVSEEKHEVVAIALRLSKSEIELVVLGNAGVPQKTIEFLNTVWQQLKELSEHYSKRHTGSRGDRDTSLPMHRPNPSDEPLRDALYRCILKFSIAKVRKQFTKYWKQLATFQRRLRIMV